MGRRGPANFTFRRWAGACELDFFACGWLAQYLATAPQPQPHLTKSQKPVNDHIQSWLSPFTVRNNL